LTKGFPSARSSCCVAGSGFLRRDAFGVGLISMAGFDSNSGSESFGGAGESGQTIEVELGDLFIKPEKFEAEAGAATFTVLNTGQTEHNFAIEGISATEMIPPGESATLTVPDLAAGTYTFICEVTGHADGGMTGTLQVAGAQGGEEGASGAHEGHGMSAKQMALTTPRSPARSSRTPRGPEDATWSQRSSTGSRSSRSPRTSSSGRCHRERSSKPTHTTMVPGPTIRGDLGDRVRLVLTNKLAEPTTTHFHGMTVPADMDGVPVMSQDAVLPGDTFTYDFTIRNSGSNMYHSHFNAQKQVPMGLLGALIVPDPGDAAVDHDITMVLNDGPLGYTMNGKGFPATAPITVQRGETFRIRYMNEGLQIHPMHLHGMPQKVVAKDGHLLPRPHMEDTVLVALGDRVDVVVEATEPGM
jgi:uncharacterized cupredoxin-like copper-binding protein